MNSIRQYYSQDIINPHNLDSSISFDIKSRIDELRFNLKKYFEWNGEIVFMPNSYYAKQLLLYNHKDCLVIDNHNLDSLNFEFLSNKFDCVEISSRSKHAAKYFDYFIFNPFDGISVLGLKALDLEPKFLGSSSVKFANRDSYSLSSDCSKYEIGTPNVGLLLYLADIYSGKR